MTLMRQITAVALAGLVAIGTPAGADSYGTQNRHDTDRQDQIGALLFGLTALAVIAGIASDRDNDDDDDDRRRDGRTIIAPPDGGRTIVAPPVSRSTNPDHIPSRCLRSIQTERGPAPLYVRACMRNYYYFIDTLPEHCFVETLNTRGTKRFGWSPYCLSQAGYDVRY